MRPGRREFYGFLSPTDAELRGLPSGWKASSPRRSYSVVAWRWPSGSRMLDPGSMAIVRCGVASPGVGLPGDAPRFRSSDGHRRGGARGHGWGALTGCVHTRGGGRRCRGARGPEPGAARVRAARVSRRHAVEARCPRLPSSRGEILEGPMRHAPRIGVSSRGEQRRVRGRGPGRCRATPAHTSTVSVPSPRTPSCRWLRPPSASRTGTRSPRSYGSARRRPSWRRRR